MFSVLNFRVYSSRQANGGTAMNVEIDSTKYPWTRSRTGQRPGEVVVMLVKNTDALPENLKSRCRVGDVQFEKKGKMWYPVFAEEKYAQHLVRSINVASDNEGGIKQNTLSHIVISLLSGSIIDQINSIKVVDSVPEKSVK